MLLAGPTEPQRQELAAIIEKHTAQEGAVASAIPK